MNSESNNNYIIKSIPTSTLGKSSSDFRNDINLSLSHSLADNEIRLTEKGQIREVLISVLQMCYRGGMAWSDVGVHVWEEVWPQVGLPAWGRVHLWIQLCHHLLHELLHALCLSGKITCTLNIINRETALKMICCLKKIK